MSLAIPGSLVQFIGYGNSTDLKLPESEYREGPKRHNKPSAEARRRS